MAKLMQFSVRKALERWCEGGAPGNISFFKGDVSSPCFIWVEPVTQGDNTLFPSYFNSPETLFKALQAQPERQFSEVIISTSHHYLRLLGDTSDLLPPSEQPCFVLHATIDEANPNAELTEQKVYSQQEIGKRFSRQVRTENPLLEKQRWAFKQQGDAWFFVGEVEGGE